MTFQLVSVSLCFEGVEEWLTYAIMQENIIAAVIVWWHINQQTMAMWHQSLVTSLNSH